MKLILTETQYKKVFFEQVGNEQIYTDEAEYQKALKKYQTKLEIYNDAQRDYNRLKNLKIPLKGLVKTTGWKDFWSIDSNSLGLFLEKYKKEKNVQTIWDHKINQWVAKDLERDKKAEKLGMKPKFYVEIVWAMGPTCENLSGLPQKECLEKSFLEPIILRNNGSEKKYPYERNFRDGWSYHISENVILYNEPKKPVFKPPTLSTTTTLLKPSEPSTSTLLPTQPEITEPKPERTKFMISWTLDKMCSIVKFFEDYKAWKSAVDLLEKNPRFSPDYKQTVGVPPSSATLQMGWLSDHPPMFDKPYFNSCSQDWIK